MSTRRVTLSTNWTRVHRGPCTIQANSLSNGVRVHISNNAVAPAVDTADYHLLLVNRLSALPYPGSDYVYCRAHSDSVCDITVTAVNTGGGDG